ncbi:TPA: ead/Ea22-like family protein [Salmonella enterica subsp. enterica serovar Anatum]
MSKINYQALREAAEQAMHDDWGFDADLFHKLVTPSIVLALLDERERNQQYIKSRDQENEDIALTVGKLRVELEAAKSKLNEQREYYEGVIADGSKRIAELEAKLETADKLQDSAFRHGLQHGFSYGQTNDQAGFEQCMAAYSTRAGIGVKQQDSVGSDVGGRNQPGMVVAIHIDAGDFVKVKGQVFEVEETDFDDHDVTLWFVGGNALKCAAGCPVEVVSEPVAAGIKVKGE